MGMLGAAVSGDAAVRWRAAVLLWVAGGMRRQWEGSAGAMRGENGCCNLQSGTVPYERLQLGQTVAVRMRRGTMRVVGRVASVHYERLQMRRGSGRCGESGESIQ